MANDAASRLPRLLYAGEVPVESTYHGSAVIYRLLLDYPNGKLLVAESGALQSLPERRLPGVAYREFRLKGDRWQYTRFSRWAGTWLSISASHNGSRLRRICRDFYPEAVLTVAHGYAWLAAAQFAKSTRIPLHLIIHDHWPAMTSLHSPFVKGDHCFGRIYREASSRLCVSPFMEEEYRKRYGVAGQVLYPSRGKDFQALDTAPKTYRKESGPLVCAFAGNIFHGYGRLIARLAEFLERRGGRVLLFGPHSPKDLAYWKLDRSNVLPQGFVKPEVMAAKLRDEVDVLFLPMAFEADGSPANMRLSFPSKLTEYTAAGLPILIWGPDYCSAVRWARQFEPVAEVVTSEVNDDDMDAALSRLEQPRHRERLGRAAVVAGNRLFSYSAAIATFYDALLAPRERSSSGLAECRVGTY
jgi:hypothetical protein